MSGRDSQQTVERKRREVAVKVGRLQISTMESERQMEYKKRKIQELLRRNQGLESLLAEAEKEKQEEQPSAVLEAARRQTVVKLWRLQVKMMKRQRCLEELMDLVLAAGSAVQESLDYYESINMKLEHVHSENVLETLETLRSLRSEVGLRSVASFDSDDLLIIERAIQENEEETKALR